MSKNFFEVIIGSIIITVGIIVAGNNIANHIPSIQNFPNSLDVMTGNDSAFNDTCLSETEAANFLRLSEEDFQKLLLTGVLDTTYAKVQGQRIFSKNKLSYYINQNLGNGVPKK